MLNKLYFKKEYGWKILITLAVKLNFGVFLTMMNFFTLSFLPLLIYYPNSLGYLIVQNYYFPPKRIKLPIIPVNCSPSLLQKQFHFDNYG